MSDEIQEATRQRISASSHEYGRQVALKTQYGKRLLVLWNVSVAPFIKTFPELNTCRMVMTADHNALHHHGMHHFSEDEECAIFTSSPLAHLPSHMICNACMRSYMHPAG